MAVTNREAVDVQAVGGDVLAEIHGFQSLAVHQQDLALAAASGMGATLVTSPP
jgi:hypothetical protein